MEATSDERREVARKLREEADIPNGMIRRSVDIPIAGVDAYIGGVGLEDATDAAKRLADLIDPTCHVVSEALHTGGFGCEEAGTEFTLSCGHTVIVDGDFPPRYCVECGARVVGE